MQGENSIYESARPLVVDLDGTLIRSDLLIEMAFGFLGRFPLEWFKLLFWLLQGRAFLKRRLAETIDVDVTTLPYNQGVLSRIRAAKTRGQPLYLASASDELLVEAVAGHLNLFDGWFASDGETNLAGRVKASRLTATFGHKNFDYIGNDVADLPVWKCAASGTVVNASIRLNRRLSKQQVFIERTGSARSSYAWLKLLRPHQWTKNALIAVPLLTAHQFKPTSVVLAFLAIMAFSACASGVYILNDLVDISADRNHPYKRKRPFAAGEISFSSGIFLMILCVLLSFGIAEFVSLNFVVMLTVYLTATTTYSVVLKRKLLIDVITLAALYTIRILAGAVAIRVPLSEWLLAFSMFIFLSMALTKRYSELVIRFDANLPDPLNRDYKKTDLPIVSALAAASGYGAAIVLALYLSSDAVRVLYARPEILWGTCLIVIYWISRVIMLSPDISPG